MLEQPVVDTPDLVLRVAMSADERELRFTLNSPSNRFALSPNFRRPRAPAGTQEPRELLESNFMSLNAMAGTSIERADGRGDEGQPERDRQDRLELVSRPVPAGTERRMAEHPDGARRKRHSEPAHPFGRTLDPLGDGAKTTGQEGQLRRREGFLCEQFRLSRWVAGRRLPDTMALNSALLIAPKSNLASVKKEKAYFTS